MIGIIRFYKSDKVKKAFKERNSHIVKNWLRLHFRCGPQSSVRYDNDFHISLRGEYTGVECRCGKIFYEEK